MMNRHYTSSYSPVLQFLGGCVLFLSLARAQTPQNFSWPDVPRIGLGGSMTVCTINTRELSNYINSYAVASQTIAVWNIAGEFSVAPEFHLSSDISLKLEYAYLLNSHRIDDPLSGGQIDFSYGIHMPSVIVQYMYISNRGYFLKIGGGIGYYFAVLDQKFPSYVGSTQSSATGPGIKVDASGQTPLGDNVFLILGTGMRFSFIGKFHGGIFDTPPGSATHVSMNFISFSVTLGFIYYF